MAGISDEDIQRVREANDIVSVFADRIPMKQRGRTFWCCCPFHEESTPSCQVDPDSQLFYCFGCHVGGDVFSYIMKTEDIDFPDAVRKLAERAGIQLTETGAQAASRSYKTRLRDACRETDAFYHNQLMRAISPEADAARAYLASRDLGGGVPKRWHLGFAPGRGALVSHLRSLGYTQKEMVDANVATENDSRRAQDRFFNRIMFPIFDESGECIAFGGRVVGKGEPKYLNSRETPIFHKSSVLYGLDKAKAAMASTGTAIVVEGYTDVIALHEAGVKNAVATLGTALTKQHIRSLSRQAGKRIVYLFDGDEAGQRAADRALGFIGESMTVEAGKHRVDLMACTLPDNLDPADFVAERGVEALQDCLNDAKPLVSYGIDRRIARFDTTSAEGRAQAFDSALSILAPIKDSILAQDYAVQIAGKLLMREDAALQKLKTLEAPRVYEDGQESSGQNAPEEVANGGVAFAAAPQDTQLDQAECNRRRFEALFIGVCARHPRLAMIHADVLAQTDWHQRLHAQISDAILSAIEATPDIAAADLMGALTREYPQSARMFVPSATDTDDPEVLAAFLIDELSIGDMESAVETYHAQLKHPETMSPQEYDLLYETVISLQKDLAERRRTHDASALRP